ncbi:S-adenosyl-L-methionine-dependent methyltransferase [Pyronema omphalodes]|nr:S-adenosyl-L-methionine-dependent methyltransferase [Pyronema omphalodes]
MPSRQPPERPLLPALEGTKFLVHFAQTHESFRQAELDSLAVHYNLPLKWIEYEHSSPFAIISLPSASDAKKLIARSILAKGVYTLWAHATDYPTLHERIQAQPELFPPCLHHTFKFTVDTFQYSRSIKEQHETIASFSYLNLQGGISMKSPELHFFVFEEFPDRKHLGRIFFGLKLGDSDRDAVNLYDLKKRKYIGTTSMDAELSLLTCNMALCAPGKLVYDPFAGTGSFLYTASHFGSTTLGSDIDGRQLRGKKDRNVVNNFKQYNMSNRYLDGFTADLTNTPLRKARYLDAIVCDPPYGVREGLKVLGSRDPEKGKTPVMVGGIPGHLRPEYIPPKRPFGFEEMLDEVLQFSVDYLVDGGRLAFWMPTANEDGETGIPKNRSLRLDHHCVQTFNKWSRRLLVYTRLKDEDVLEETEEEKREREDKRGTADQLNGFRKKVRASEWLGNIRKLMME